MQESTASPAAVAALAALRTAVPGVAVVRLIPVHTDGKGGPLRRTHVSLWDGEGVEIEAPEDAHRAALAAVRAAYPGTARLGRPYEYRLDTNGLEPAAALRIPPELAPLEFPPHVGHGGAE